MTQIHIPSVPKRRTITQTMVEDFLIDPVLGAKVLMGLSFDAFQKFRLRTYWWVPNVIDSSGYGTGKSRVFWAYLNLRAMLIPGQQLMAYYQSFGAGKDIFWPNYDAVYHPLFEAQKGRVDREGGKVGKDNQAMPECWHQHFRNGSHIKMPAPGWLKKASGEAGKTYHRAGVDEFTKIEKMGRHDQSGKLVEETGGIDSQVLGRLRAPTFNQYHPLWANGIVFLATAESPAHPSWKRYKQYLDEALRGNPDYAVVTACYKDFSRMPCYFNGPNDLRTFREVIPNWPGIDRMLKRLTRTHARREVYGVWAQETAGWYSEAALQRCVLNGIQRGVKPEIARPKGGG